MGEWIIGIILGDDIGTRVSGVGIIGMILGDYIESGLVHIDYWGLSPNCGSSLWVPVTGMRIFRVHRGSTPLRNTRWALLTRKGAGHVGISHFSLLAAYCHDNMAWPTSICPTRSHIFGRHPALSVA